MDSNEKLSHITTSFGEMSRKERRRFAKQTKMFKGDDRNAWRVMNKAARIQERHRQLEAVKNMPAIPHKCGKEDCELCRPPLLNKAM